MGFRTPRCLRKRRPSPGKLPARAPLRNLKDPRAALLRPSWIYSAYAVCGTISSLAHLAIQVITLGPIGTKSR
jgi:hypothetical protein